MTAMKLILRRVAGLTEESGTLYNEELNRWHCKWKSRGRFPGGNQGILPATAAATVLGIRPSDPESFGEV